MFEFTYNNIRIRARFLTVLLWILFAVARLFGAYPYVWLNAIALADFAFLLIGDVAVMASSSSARMRIIVAVRVVVTSGAIAAAFLFLGPDYLWLLVLAIRLAGQAALRSLIQKPESPISTAIGAADQYDDGDLRWLDAAIEEARVQPRWRALVGMYRINRRILTAVAERVIDSAPKNAKKSVLAAHVISNPLLLASYIDVTEKKFSGSLDDWLNEVWQSLRSGLDAPTRFSNFSRSLPLSRRYVRELPVVIHGKLLEDEEWDRGREAPSPEVLQRRAKSRFETYGTVGPWTTYQRGLALENTGTDLGAAKLEFLDAALLAEGLLGGSIKVLSRLSPLPGMNPEFDDVNATGRLEPEDKRALILVCVDCRARLAEAFFHHGLVDEARRSIVDAFDQVRGAPLEDAEFLDPSLEKLLHELVGLEAWTGNWRGLDLLLPPGGEQATVAQTVVSLAASALTLFAAGDKKAAREATIQCAENLEPGCQLGSDQWAFVYTAGNVAMLTGEMPAARYLIERWQRADKAGDWNDKEREVQAGKLLLLIEVVEKSDDIVHGATYLLLKAIDATADAAGELTQGELLSWLERSYMAVSSALTVLLNWPDDPPEEELVEPTVLAYASMRSISLSALRFRRGIVSDVNHEGLTAAFRERGSLASDLASHEFQSRLTGVIDRGERIMMDRRSVYDIMLANYFAQYDASELRRVPPVAEIQDALGGDEVFVFLFRYGHVDPYAESGYKTEYYGAAVVRPDASMRVVRLGDAGALDFAINRLIGKVYDGDPGWERQADALSELLAPLLELLETVGQWVIWPADKLNQVPFCLLKSGEVRAADVASIRYVSSLSELLWRKPKDVKSGPSLVVGNPDFDYYDPDAATLEIMSEYMSPEEQEARRSGASKPIDRHFEPLGETETEAHEVAEALGVEARTGKDARESLIKSMASPRIMHIATHGYWIRSAEDGGLEYPDALRRRFESSEYSHPFSRSGVALAGANWFVDNLSVSDGDDDGLLNGYDVLELDLAGTELVVLSACRTGAGDSMGMAGAMGLRFAFAAAGARSQLTTLWPVGDRVTRMFMRSFYDALVHGKQSRSSALATAQDAIRSQPNYEHPFFWAAFALWGDGSPLFE